MVTLVFCFLTCAQVIQSRADSDARFEKRSKAIVSGKIARPPVDLMGGFFLPPARSPTITLRNGVRKFGPPVCGETDGCEDGEGHNETYISWRFKEPSHILTPPWYVMPLESDQHHRTCECLVVSCILTGLGAQVYGCCWYRLRPKKRIFQYYSKQIPRPHY